MSEATSQPTFLEEDFSPVGRYCVLYQTNGNSELHSIEIPAAHPMQALRAVAAGDRIAVSVTPVRFDPREFWEHQRLFTVHEAARFCRLESPANIRRAITDGKLAAARPGSTPLIARAELLKWREAQRIPGAFHVSLEEAA